MAIAQSKLSPQGQISIPVEIRKRLGLSPGSVLEWDDRGGDVIVRKAGRFTAVDVHETLFGNAGTPKPKSDVKEGIRKYVRRRHARG